LTQTRPISDIRVGDTVLAFDPAADLGRGALVPRKVTRLYRNTTEEWIRLTWREYGEQKELVATPGHHFLDRFGNFPTIEEMLAHGGAMVVLASGELTEVTAERIIYSAETAHLFERAQAEGVVAGSAAMKPAPIDAWQTYNFEVEDLHTYVAGGVRVHNQSGFDKQLTDKLSDAPPKPNSLGVAYDQGKAFIEKGVVASGNGASVTVVDKSAPSAGSKSDGGPKATFKGGDGGKTQGSTSSSGSTQKSKDDGGSFNTGGFGSSDKGQDKGGSSASSSSSSKGGSSASSKGGDKGGSSSSSMGDSKGGSGGSSKGGDKGGSSSGKGDSKGGSSKSAKPIVLDLDGDGIEVSLSYSASFDYDGDGFLERTAWAAADDAFLVIDLNADGTRGAGDGQIDQRSELVLSDWGPEGATDLQALAEATDEDGNLLFDTNGDGVLDANDTSYGEFRVWQDLDQDGTVDDGELRTLAEAGISQINLTYDNGLGFEDTADDVSVGLAALLGTASFVIDGETRVGGVGDLELVHADQGWRRVETETGYRIEFETGEAAEHRVLAEGETGFDLGDDTTDFRSATGNASANLLDASAKTEGVVLAGLEGDDTLLGGAGADVLAGGAGADSVDAGAGDDVIFADAEDDVPGGAIQGGAGYDQLIMTEDALLSIGDLAAIGIEAVEAGDGDDSITGTDDATGYVLSGNGGNDTLTSAGGNDVLSGGAGDDSLASGAGSDILIGGSGNDRLDAGADDDVLAGGRDDDTLLGGAGDDLYLYARGDGHDLIRDHAEGTYFERVETTLSYDYEKEVRKGSGKDARYVTELRTGYVTTTVLEERYGQVDGGIDTLEFTRGIALEDVLFARDGEDAVFSFRAVDAPETEADESQTVSETDSARVRDWANEMNRIENLSFTNGLDLDVSQILQGQTGHGGADLLTGTEEGDWINAGAGDDTLTGGGGRDVLIAGDGADLLDGGADRDILAAGAGDDSASGGAGDDVIQGGDGADTLAGGTGDDVLLGEAGDDLLQGGAGNDLLFGGTGNDRLEGGAGDDVYFYFRGDGQDTIHDHATEMRAVEEATGRLLYQRSGKSGRWVEETRTVQRAVQVDGGWDALQFGYAVLLADVVFELRGDDLLLGIRQVGADGTALTLDEMADVVTVEAWANEMNRVEELRFGDGLSIDISEVNGFHSGLDADDLLTGGAGSDLMTGGAGADTLDGGDGRDILAGGAGDDSLAGGRGDDDVYGNAGSDTLEGGAGDDYLLAGDGDDVLDGGDGDDVLIGGRGDDLLRGGRGNDVYIFNRGDGHDTIDESIFAITEGGTTSVETGIQDFVTETQTRSVGGKWPWSPSTTHEVNVWVSESRTGATIEALEGGDDVLQFGVFIDIGDLIVQSLERGANESLLVELRPLSEDGTITDSITIENWNIDAFRVETFRFANGFTLDMGAIGHAETGGAEDDVISAAGVTLEAGEGVWLGGGEGADTLQGSAANDILIGGIGGDRLEGGAGNDTYVFAHSHGTDRIADSGSTGVRAGSSAFDAAKAARDGLGGDRLLFGAGIEIEDLVLQREEDVMTVYVADQSNLGVPLAEITDRIEIEGWENAGTRVELLQFTNGFDLDISAIEETHLGADVLGDGSETPVDDTLIGSENADWMDGFAGNDLLTGLDGNDILFGRDGDDTLEAGRGNDLMSGGAGNDVLRGDAGSDIMTGGAGDDDLSGGTGDDVLMGGTGNDRLDGGLGADLLIGDLGDDVIVASAGADIIRFGFGDGADRYRGAARDAAEDVMVFEDDVAPEDVWFERVGNDLVVRLHGAEDSLTFEGWYLNNGVNMHVNGFAAGGQWLSYTEVNTLVTAMAPHVANLNDGTTAYGILPGEEPEDISLAIDTAWV
jgi:Ca2+-binding RTX toxin-like protein